MNVRVGECVGWFLYFLPIHIDPTRFCKGISWARPSVDDFHEVTHCASMGVFAAANHFGSQVLHLLWEQR